MSSTHEVPTQRIPRLLYYLLQPVILLAVIGVWLTDPTNGSLFFITILFLQLTLGAIERRYPDRPEWQTPAKQTFTNVLLVAFLFVVSGSVGEIYTHLLSPPLDGMRTALGLDIWPHDWPLVVQLFMVFTLNEFFWYWIHRAEHQWSPIWRLSGHGAHHAFRKLSALNFGLNHPLEYFFLLLPAALLQLTFGIGAPVLGAALLLVTQASIAHCNIATNSRLIGWFFTTNQYHICHHSTDREESNSNFGCAAIVWDRVFGTFCDNRVIEAGAGPMEPNTWQKLILPIKEFETSSIAPGTQR